jgi:DNA-binding PucR family transcriptional regulator
MLRMERQDDDVAEIVRRGAQIVLATLDEVTAGISELHLRTPGMERVAQDPVFAAASLRTIRSTLAHCAAAVIDHPLEPIPAAGDAETFRMARDLVRRDLDESVLVAYRVGQVGAWQAWVSITCNLTDDVGLVRRVLDRTAASIGDFVERTLDRVQQAMREERADLLRGNNPERREMVARLLDGAPVARERASARLGLDLAQPHTAAVVWLTPGRTEKAPLEEAVDLLIRSTAARRHVSVFPSTGVAWLWLAGAGPEATDVEPELRGWPVRVAIGETSTGVEGFRASHRSALAVQRLVSRSGLRRVVRAEDVRLASLLSRHGDEALDFARSVLGDLTGASTDVLLTVRTYLDELGSVSRTAERLYTHRNTVVRRLARADELLPLPLTARPVDVAAALEMWQWLGHSVTDQQDGSSPVTRPARGQ